MLQSEQIIELGGLNTCVVGDPEHAQVAFALLHGYAMSPQDLAPFMHSLGRAVCLLPAAPHELESGGRAWWPVDLRARKLALAHGPRDLSGESPVGRNDARAALAAFLCAARNYIGNLPLVLGGFSQGGMLACDAVLLGECNADALVLLSASRIAFSEWQPQLQRLAGWPVFASHGQEDRDLAFAAGERLRDSLQAASAEVEWFPFAGGHTIPLPVWRALRKFLVRVAAQPRLKR